MLITEFVIDIFAVIRICLFTYVVYLNGEN